MTLIAGIRCINSECQVRTGNTHAVIPARVDLHVSGFRHVAIGTLGTGAVSTVVVVSRYIVGGGLMALRAYRVTIRSQLRRVRVVAIAADNTGLLHLALDKRTVNVNLIEDLPVRVVHRLLKQTQRVRIQQVGAMAVGTQRAPP